MIRVLAGGYTEIWLVGAISGRSSGTSCAAELYWTVITCVMVCSPGRGMHAGGDIGILFRVTERNQLDEAAGTVDRGITLRLQRGEKYLVNGFLGHRLGGDDGQLALDARVEQEILARDLRHGLDHRLDVRFLKVEHHFARTQRLSGGGCWSPPAAGRGEAGMGEAGRGEGATPIGVRGDAGCWFPGGAGGGTAVIDGAFISASSDCSSCSC